MNFQSSARPNPLFLGSAETETETTKVTETEPNRNRNFTRIFLAFIHISYPAVFRAQISLEEKAIRGKDCQIVLRFLLFLKQILFIIFFSNVFKLVNWQKIEKSFGFGSVEFSLVSAETETSPKLLISAETETETGISVVH